MEMQFESLLTQVTSFIQNEAKSETVIGKPFTLGEFSCIPVIRVGMGFGSGGGEGDAPKTGHGEGAAVGAGMGVEPIGFLVTKGKEISFVSTKSNRGLAAAFEKVPDLIEKFMDIQAKKDQVVAASN
jgi:uncharacterized spore protein YtfJ